MHVASRTHAVQLCGVDVLFFIILLDLNCRDQSESAPLDKLVGVWERNVCLRQSSSLDLWIRGCPQGACAVSWNQEYADYSTAARIHSHLKLVGHGGQEIATPLFAVRSKIDVVHNKVVDVNFWLVLLAFDFPHFILRDPF
jgi:hypothetical protein